MSGAVVLVNTLAVILFLIVWVTGMVLAQGWGFKICAIFPPYGWYVVVERILQLTNILGPVGGL